MARVCNDCRFWSQMIARAHGGGPVEAFCLGDGGPKVSTYTTASDSCSGWKDDWAGKVDDPPNYGEYNRAEYATQEGPSALKAKGETQ